MTRKMSSFKAMLKNRLHREGIYSTSEYWDSKATEHVGDAISMWPNNHLNIHYHAETLGVIEKYLKDVTGKRTLDVGCGTGRISRFFAHRGAIVQGIDFSAKALEVARRTDVGDNPSYRLQSLFDLDEKGVYDIAVSWGSLTFACRSSEQLLAAMTRMAQALKPDGRALFLEPVHRGFLHRVLNMNVREFCRVMEQAGFKVESVANMHFWPMRLLLAYISWPRFITSAGYHVGQGVMKIMNSRAMGDYKAIYATVRRGPD